MAWDVLSGAAKMAWDVLSGVTKTAWDVLSGVVNRCGMFCPGCQKMAWDVLSRDVLSYIRLCLVKTLTCLCPTLVKTSLETIAPGTVTWLVERQTRGGGGGGGGGGGSDLYTSLTGDRRV